MRAFVIILVVSSMALSGCSRLRDSKLNPGNWFGKSQSRPVAGATVSDNPLIPQKSGGLFRRGSREVYYGTPVDRITDVKVEQTSTGAIVHVTAVSLQQGAYDVRLTSANNGDPVDGVLTYRLMAVQPRDMPQGSPRQRTIHAGRYVSNSVLAATRSIVVIGARNQHASRR